MVRKFTTGRNGGTIAFEGRRIFLEPAVDPSSGGSLRVYSAFFGRGERADLPAPYDEVWVVVRGRIAVGAGAQVVTAAAGEFVHVPENSPGEVRAVEDSELVCVCAPAR